MWVAGVDVWMGMETEIKRRTEVEKESWRRDVEK